MNYVQFLIWAGKQGFKYGQRYLYKAWKEAEKLGKPIVENQFPKLLNKAKDYYKNFKTFDPKVVPKPTPDKVTKIPTKFKTRPVESKPPLQLSEKNRLGQEAFQFFGTLGKNNPFKGRDGPKRLADWMYDLKPAEVMKVMKDYGYKPKIIPKAQGGIASLKEGGPSQKEIDKGIAAIEKLKSSLMPESYEALIEIYKDKQKDLNIDIMESAGGLGEMLGEGGRAGFDTGGSSIRKYEIPPKVWPLVVEMYEKAGGRGETGMSLKEFAFQYFNKAKGGRVGMMYGGDPGFAFSYGGSWADWKDNHASEMPLMDYINQKLPKARNPFTDKKYQEGGEVTLSWEEILEKFMQDQPLTDEERKILSGGPKAELPFNVDWGGAVGILPKDFDDLTPPEDRYYDRGVFAGNVEAAEGGRIGFSRAGVVPYLSRGWSQPGVYKAPRGFTGMQDILGIGGTGGILALRQKDKDKKKQPPQKKGEPNYPEPKPPFKIGDLIIDFIVANSRLPKKSEEGRLKEMLRVATEKITPTQRMKDQGVEGDFSDYEYTGDETTEDLYRLEEEGTIKRDDWNVFSPRYDEYLDAQIINKHHLYTVKEWENTPDTIKDKIRAQINPDWAEARFGEDWHEVLDKQRTNEIKQDDPDFLRDVTPVKTKKEFDKRRKAPLALRTEGIMQALKILREGWGLTSSKGKLHAWPGTFDKTKTMMNKFKNKFGDAESFAAMKGKILKTQLENDIKGYKDLINNYKKDYSKWELDDFKETINAIKKDVKLVDKYILKSQSKKATKHAEGGRIGFQEGTGIMSQTGIPYYADKAVEGIVHSAETLSKLPFAGGELISKLLRQKPNKKMFTDALENITPGSWSKNLGISSLAEAEGAKVSPKQKTIGNVLGLGTEIAVPVGGAFKIGQNLINQASKAMGKLKKGKTLNQTIDDKITSFGQSRRDFNIMAGTSGLMVALKAIGLGSIFKAAPTKDFAVKLKTYWHNSDVDYGTSGMATFDLTALTAPVRTALKSIMNKAQKFKHNYGEKLSSKEYIDIDPGDAKFIVKELQKKGFTGKFTGIADEGGDVLKQAEKAGQKDFVKTYKKQSMKQNVKDHQLYNDYVVYENDPGFLHWNEATKGKLNKPFVSTIDEVVEILEPVVKKGEGGSVGYPPLQPMEKPQGPFYETNNPNEAFKEILRQGLGSGITGAPIGGGFSLDAPYGPNQKFDLGVGFNTDPMSSGFSAGYGVNLDGNDTMGAGYNSPGGTFSMGVNKQEGSDPQWNFQKKWKFGGPKKYAKGGKTWQPKSAPKLTTTIPPERGPTPQGLTYLTGDDIVQNIG